MVLFHVFFLFLLAGDKPHACELCGKKFALACNLRAHMKTHEGKLNLLFYFIVFLFYKFEDHFSKKKRKITKKKSILFKGIFYPNKN